jgi:omega-hydroxy-beta-dihydromenaquinone-9 sulfotransferase
MMTPDISTSNPFVPGFFAPIITDCRVNGIPALQAQRAARPDYDDTAASAELNGYPLFAYRIWYGMRISTWLSLLSRNRFAVSPARTLFCLRGCLCSLVNSSLNLMQRLIFGQRIRGCVLDAPPIFIIGHWRTGTTLLHELLTLEPRFTAPTTIECFAPAVCLVFGRVLRWLTYILPANRPMDNMPVGWDRAQEDEFALMNLGLGSPYETMIFPNHRTPYHPYLNMTELGSDEIRAWKTGFLSFLQQVDLRSKREEQRLQCGLRRVVLKSPPHTARLHILREMFPEAQFIHVVRDPCEVFPSTVRLWRALFHTQGCQKPQFEDLTDGACTMEEYVFENMNLLYRDFFAEVAKIPPGNFCELRYEDLVRNPAAEINGIYRQLGLGSFESIRPRLEAHLRERGSYKSNRHHISDEQRAEVSRRWGWYMDRFGYRAQSQEKRHSARELIPA